MKKGMSFYRRLFLSTFTLSAFTFGGGYVIVPLMQKRFVKKLKWIDEDEMLDLVAIAQSAPGPIAVNTSIIVGYRLAGVPGALTAILGTVLPPLVVIVAISYFYAAFSGNFTVRALLAGMQAGVAAVIADVVIDMTARIIKSKAIAAIILMAAAFIAAAVFNVGIPYILLACGALGALYTARRAGHAPNSGKSAGGRPEPDQAVPEESRAEEEKGI